MAVRWHNLDAAAALQTLGASPEGLAPEEAARRLLQHGRNEIARHKPVSPLRLLLRQFSSFFVLVLLFAALLAYAVSFMPGEGERRLTAYFILAIVAISAGLSFFQEYRAQHDLLALNKLLPFKATVRRGGLPLLIDAAELVPGDILVLTHGQKVPADARLLEAHALRADESALTGESAGVDKSPESVAPDAPLAERTGMVFGSTFLTRGSGVAVAVSTGMATEVGRIAATLQEMAERPTPFQIEVQKMARQMAAIVGLLALAVAAVLFFLLHQPLIDVALNTLSLAVATIPESLPIVLTFALALGARQMALRRAVVRRLSVVESLGSVDIICTDKTGTLTQNNMAVERVFCEGALLPPPQAKPGGAGMLALLRAGVLCNEASIQDRAAFTLIGDPVDTALLRAAHAAGIDPEAVRAECPKLDEIPFSSERKMMTTVHAVGGAFVAFTKGSPETLLPRCAAELKEGAAAPLDAAGRQAIQTALAQLESDAFYVLAFAQKTLAAAETAGADETMVFLGLQAMMDPPHPEAAAVVARAQGAGIRVVMITGDNALTARAIGRQLRIGEQTVEAAEIDALPPEKLRERMTQVQIVARATPQTKQRVLQALQDAGHFVAMTGDGVNDATALKQSDVGVAMGLRGTDIAKESADMVLLDDNFTTIVAAIEEGRRIFDNIRKFTNYLLSTSLGEVLVVLALSLTGYFPLSARMLLWINVVTDLFPASALAADPAVPHVMARRPRRHDEPILNTAIYATIAGSIFRTLIAYTVIFCAGLRLGGLEYARTMLFTGIVLHAFTRVMVVRQLDALSFWSNRPLLWSYLAAVGLQLVVLYTPMRAVFGVEPLGLYAWLVLVSVVVASSVWGVYMTRWILRAIPLWR